MPTRCVSLDASLSTGMMNKQKNSESMANPLAVRVCGSHQRVYASAHDISYHNSVIPGKYCKVIKSSNKVPPRSDVAGYEDPKGENREGVHESLSLAHHRVRGGLRTGGDRNKKNHAADSE
jgi:hypothetical protein